MIPTNAMKLRTLADIKSFKGKRVLLRVDFNVPLGLGGSLDAEGDARIRAALPTIEYLLKKGARVIAVSHLGRPEGRDKEFTLAPVARHLGLLLEKPVLFAGEALDDDKKVEKQLAALRNGEVALLENIRFYKGEEENSVFLARRLASLADVFVFDAFAVAHRAHASTVGVATLLPSAAGKLVEKEVKNLEKTLLKPKRPFVVLMGGAKISGKLPTLERLAAVADTVLIGGGMANSFFKAAGFDVGKSKVEAEDVKLAKKLMKDPKVVIPTDVLASTSLTKDAGVRVCAPGAVKPAEYIVDIGTSTITAYAKILKSARTIVWNGPVGLFEVKKFSHGSVSLGRVIAARSSGGAFGVVGGGETVACLEQTGMAEYVDHVSTGGGAMLDFLAGKKLPALEALMKTKG